LISFKPVAGMKKFSTAWPIVTVMSDPAEKVENIAYNYNVYMRFINL